MKRLLALLRRRTRRRRAPARRAGRRPRVPRVCDERRLGRCGPAAPRREHGRPRHRARHPRRLLPHVRRGLAADSHVLRHPRPVSHRPPGRDALDAREVHAGRGLDACRAGRRDAASRREGQRDRARHGSPGGGALGCGRRARLSCEPPNGVRRERAARAAHRLRAARARAATSHRVPPVGTHRPETLRDEGRTAAPVPDDDGAPRVLRRVLDRRWRRALLPAAVGRRRHDRDRDPLPRQA